MKIIQGHFNGTGAALHLCLGTIPYNIVLWNLESATVETLEWDRAMLHDILTVEGIERPKGGGAVLDYAFGEGVAPYYGGDVMTTTNQPSVVYGHADVDFVERDDKDYRFYTNSAAGISGDASTVDITTWTLQTAGTPTGKFNGDVVGTYIGEGSIIRIQTNDNKHVYEATITADLSSTGAGDNEVYLSQAVPSGKVVFIGGKYGYKPVPIGAVAKPGVLITNTTINASGGTVGFRALCP